MDGDATAMMETPKKSLYCRNLLNELSIIKIALIASKGRRRRG
jgi:hypothetical protein